MKELNKVFLTVLQVSVLNLFYNVERVECVVGTKFTSLCPFDQNKVSKKLQLECIDEIKVNPDLVMTLRRGKWPTNPDTSLQFWTLCVLHKIGLMTKSGTFQMDEALSLIPEEEREEREAILDSCLPKKFMLPEQKAWHYLQCINDEKKQIKKKENEKEIKFL